MLLDQKSSNNSELSDNKKKENHPRIKKLSDQRKSKSDLESTVLLGQRVHYRRKELGLSLRNLAEQTGLTASFLSQFECGNTSASIRSLRKICKVLNISLFALLSEESTAVPVQENTPVRSYSPVVRARQRAKINYPNIPVIYELLTSSPSWKMGAFYNRLAAGKSNVVRQLRQPTEELLFVISGGLTIEMDDGLYTLYEQDALYFEGKKLIKLSNLSELEEVVWLSIITPAVF